MKKERTAQIEFLTSAVQLSGCPDFSLPEVALIGRSNAGKSSFINGLGNSKIAKVSSMPGKTTLLNFFSVNKKYRLVDMPGYGFAARGASERDSWQGMIEPYLSRRDNLAGLIIVMDIRRDWSEDEETLRRWIYPRALPLAIVLTKSDKLTKNEIQARRAAIRKQAETEAIFVTSALKKTGYQEIDDYVYESWIKEWSL